MRVQLHLQCLKFRLDQTLLQFERAQFTFAILPVIIEGMTHRHNDPVNQEVEMPGFDQQGFENIFIRGLTLPLSNPGAECHIGKREQDAGQQMNTEIAQARGAFQPKAAGQINYWDR